MDTICWMPFQVIPWEKFLEAEILTLYKRIAEQKRMDGLTRTLYGGSVRAVEKRHKGNLSAKFLM